MHIDYYRVAILHVSVLGTYIAIYTQMYLVHCRVIATELHASMDLLKHQFPVHVILAYYCCMYNVKIISY